MNKNEFLHTLGEKLKEELTTSQIEEHLHYYNDYIKQEESTGKSEQDVIASLGDPTLLARTILETPSTSAQTGVYQDASEEDIYQEDNADQQTATRFSINTTSRWGCLAVAIVAIMVIGLILWIFGIVFKALTPILVPILVVLFVFAIFKQRR